MSFAPDPSSAAGNGNSNRNHFTSSQPPASPSIIASDPVPTNDCTTAAKSHHHHQQQQQQQHQTLYSGTRLPPEELLLASRLFHAAQKGETDIFEQALTRSRRIVDISNEKGDSLIMLASYHGHLPLTKLLLSSGADPDRLNDRRQSPLAGAIFKGEDAIIEALLGAGADPRIGQPSALQVVDIFGQRERWGERMQQAAEEAERKTGMISNGVSFNDEVDGDGDEIYAEARVGGE